MAEIGDRTDMRFVEDIFSPINELEKLRYQLIEDIKYWDKLKITEKVKFLEAQKNDYERAINCLKLELHNYD